MYHFSILYYRKQALHHPNLEEIDKPTAFEWFVWVSHRSSSFGSWTYHTLFGPEVEALPCDMLNIVLLILYSSRTSCILLFHPHMSGCVGDGGEHPRGGVGDWEPAERKPATWGGRGEVLAPHGEEEGKIEIQCHVLPLDLTPWNEDTLQTLLRFFF